MPQEPDIAKELKKLYELQSLDSQIYELSQKKDALPAEKQRIETDLEAKGSALEEAENALQSVIVSKNEQEMEMQSGEEKIKKLEADLFQIKNNKEYSALKLEIEGVKADVSLLEEKIILLYDDIDKAKQKIKAEKSRFDEEKKKAEAEKQKISVLEKEISSKLKELASQREDSVKKIEPELLQTYQKILNNRGKLALTLVQGDFCGACNMQLRPQIINSAKIKKKIVICENCGRVLYARD